ncbi:hypothetical protein [uncultured Secundilactobacillus sp.]|uniref:hypothetical protein n=1 Tax=uncultured Secundilactobacillus sp. TaxID=2813935 RepID=UPI002582874D|nr:hypothetical protein [uncultured Secundilactobacillus sp.]
MSSTLDLAAYEKRAAEAQAQLTAKRDELALKIGRDLMKQYDWQSWKAYQQWAKQAAKPQEVMTHGQQ